MNEYMIRFTDGTIKHIKADACKFTVSANVPMVDFFKDGRLFYAINLTSVSAFWFGGDLYMQCPGYSWYTYKPYKRFF